MTSSDYLVTAQLLGRSPFHAPVAAAKQTALTSLCEQNSVLDLHRQDPSICVKGNHVAEGTYDEGYLD